LWSVSAGLKESFVSIGTALPALTDHKKDKNEFKPVWDQEVYECCAPHSSRESSSRFEGGLTDEVDELEAEMMTTDPRSIGTALPALTDHKKDKNEFKPVWDQEVYDEQGRRRRLRSCA
jgi:hypothetical protein